MLFFLYNLLLVLLSPLLMVFLWIRRARGKESPKTWRERWGHLPTLPNRDGSPTIWVHAVSVGEVMAAVPVLRELRAQFPPALLVLSTTTVGGREVAEKQIDTKLADVVVAFPLDFPQVVRRAFRVVRPDAVVLMEWEIWPNFLFAAVCPVVVLNGRISDKGLRRGLGSRWFLKTVLGRVAQFAMQSDEDARRAALVGARAERVRVLGNTKFDEATHALTDAERVALRADLGFSDDGPILVCGSTRPGEEAILSAAIYELLRTTVPNLRIVVAPRHLDRKEVAGDPFVSEPEFAPLVWRSEQQSSPTQMGVVPRILMLDTFGELAKVYAVADVAFVGGSLLPFGGQSVFQPLAQGVPTLFGPHMNNQRDIAALAQSAGVGFVVRDAEQFAREVTRLLFLPADERESLRKAARDLIERNQGVARQGAELVARLIADGGTRR